MNGLLEDRLCAALAALERATTIPSETGAELVFIDENGNTQDLHDANVDGNWRARITVRTDMGQMEGTNPADAPLELLACEAWVETAEEIARMFPPGLEKMAYPTDGSLESRMRGFLELNDANESFITQPDGYPDELFRFEWGVEIAKEGDNVSVKAYLENDVAGGEIPMAEMTLDDLMDDCRFRGKLEREPLPQASSPRL